MHKMTKACDISQKVKREVWERDGGHCIFCGSPYAFPNMHFIPRSHGGLGIPENIGTGCMDCHNRLDNSGDRREMLSEFEVHLKSFYPEWDKENLVYRKWNYVK